MLQVFSKEQRQKRNYLIHLLYVRKEYSECLDAIRLFTRIEIGREPKDEHEPGSRNQHDGFPLHGDCLLFNNKSNPVTLANTSSESMGIDTKPRIWIWASVQGTP